MLLDRDDDGSARYALLAADRFAAIGYLGLAANARTEARERRVGERQEGRGQ
jgi:hypothetical protein